MHARTLNSNRLATGCCLFIAIFFTAILSGCRGSGEPTNATNTPPSTQPETRAVAPSPPLASPTSAATVATPAAPPQPSEVQAALTRVYQTTVVADERGLASAVTGDFNGDASQDIAIVVKPNPAQLSEINSELSNWILEDPRHVLPPAMAARVDQGATPPAPRVQVEAGNTLLAVIHGFQSEGWRNADAKQTYLLRNAAGTEMHTQTSAEARRLFKEAAAAHHLPYVRGDLIWQVLDGKTGCLYWTGAKYAWYDQSRYRRTARPKGTDASTGR